MSTETEKPWPNLSYEQRMDKITEAEKYIQTFAEQVANKKLPAVVFNKTVTLAEKAKASGDFAPFQRYVVMWANRVEQNKAFTNPIWQKELDKLRDRLTVAKRQHDAGDAFSKLEAVLETSELRARLEAMGVLSPKPAGSEVQLITTVVASEPEPEAVSANEDFVPVQEQAPAPEASSFISLLQDLRETRAEIFTAPGLPVETVAESESEEAIFESALQDLRESVAATETESSASQATPTEVRKPLSEVSLSRELLELAAGNAFHANLLRVFIREGNYLRPAQFFAALDKAYMPLMQVDLTNALIALERKAIKLGLPHRRHIFKGGRGATGYFFGEKAPTSHSPEINTTSGGGDQSEVAEESIVAQPQQLEKKINGLTSSL